MTRKEGKLDGLPLQVSLFMTLFMTLCQSMTLSGLGFESFFKSQFENGCEIDMQNAAQ